jgi:hypothetical protein
MHAFFSPTRSRVPTNNDARITDLWVLQRFGESSNFAFEKMNNPDALGCM